jgi:hypothetical protein
MNDSELEKVLKTEPAPDRTPEFWEDFPRRVSGKIHWRAQHEATPGVAPRHRWSGLAWGLSVGTACLVLGIALGNWRGAKRANALLQNEKLVREVLAMFPNQVRAIVQDENGLSLSLADEPNVPSSTPLWIKICDGKQCRSVVTFSGQAMQIAGQRVEVLADARGGVMLLGDHFFWSSRETVLKDHLRIDAQPLSHVL